MEQCWRCALTDTSVLTVQILYSHNFMTDSVPLSNILLLLGMPNYTITALWREIDGLLKLLITVNCWKATWFVLNNRKRIVLPWNFCTQMVLFLTDSLHLLSTLFPIVDSLWSPKQQTHRGHVALHQDATAIVLRGQLATNQQLFHAVSETDTRIWSSHLLKILYHYPMSPNGNNLDVWYKYHRDFDKWRNICYTNFQF